MRREHENAMEIDLESCCYHCGWAARPSSVFLCLHLRVRHNPQLHTVFHPRYCATCPCLALPSRKTHCGNTHGLKQGLSGSSVAEPRSSCCLGHETRRHTQTRKFVSSSHIIPTHSREARRASQAAFTCTHYAIRTEPTATKSDTYV